MQFYLKFVGLISVIHAQTTLDQPPGPNTFTPTPTLESSANLAPSVTPNIVDPTAPNAQEVCPGYIASNIRTSNTGIVADLTLAGDPCNAYGNDILDLILNVQYQNATRLNVKIYPKYLVPANHSFYILGDELSPSGKIEDGCSVENMFEDQFLEVVTGMVEGYNVYGLPEAVRGTFRLPNEYTQTFWNQLIVSTKYNEMNDQPLDANMHSVHPVYLETRYNTSTPNTTSTSHIVYARNLHGQEWILKPDKLIYRTIGGSLDFYFFSGPEPTDALAQQQLGVIGTPAMQPYWAHGFHQVRWGYQNWTVLQEIVDGYRDARIPLEAIWNDLDYLLQYRIFSHNNNTYPVPEGREFLERLHANGQYWMPILDPNVYVPDPTNTTDAFPTYDRGDALSLYIRRGQNSEEYYTGIQWPGFSVWPDFLLDSAHGFWADEMVRYHNDLPFDGWWLDISDLSSWCTGSCGSGRIKENPIHVPFKLPGEPGEINYDYPEAFDITNSTEAASASAASLSQASAYPTPMTTTGTPTVGFTSPTPGVRNLTFPPYALNLTLEGHSLLRQAVAPYATHNDPYHTTEYELHNLYGILSTRATYNGLLRTKPGLRPFLLSRSTSPGSGNLTGHWGGDTNSRWGNMYMTIPQALTFSIAGIPFFGTETCGFNGNTDMELCTRWMQLSAFFPLYRNHNSRNTIAQEAFRWATTAEATRRAMRVRFQLLAYTYTLFHSAHTHGTTILRALSWNFPHDPSLAHISNQFMLGPSILITPVLAPLLTSAHGVFPGIAQGTRWYDWYTLSEIHASPGQNVSLPAPLEHIPVHVRGGAVIASQEPGNTTGETRRGKWGVVIVLNEEMEADGEIYLDDGVSLEQEKTKIIQFTFSNQTLTTSITGSYVDTNPLSNVTIAGWRGRPISRAVIANSPRRGGDAAADEQGKESLRCDLRTTNGDQRQRQRHQYQDWGWDGEGLNWFDEHEDEQEQEGADSQTYECVGFEEVTREEGVWAGELVVRFE
ncbi:glycoside hydrolase family 31 protein [Periconia macrospinosa]|uniref:alpha-glucosidase n=1 Tax=Periconia macrospinosa TaxID=97972 RepID=A0A2V1DBS1_9PLEO|nr:glycoside hydrolase family 31 protein [Periconia macrospinosa]